jgi:hypothetical protein
MVRQNIGRSYESDGKRECSSRKAIISWNMPLFSLSDHLNGNNV